MGKMKRKERIFWIIFYIFPIVANILIFIYLRNDKIDVVKTETKISFVKKSNDKKKYNVRRYHSWNSNILHNTNTYTLESDFYRLRNYQNNAHLFTKITYPKKDIFFEYYFIQSELSNLRIADESDDISYDKEHQQLIVHHGVPQEQIIIQKDEIHGIKVVYVYDEELKND